MYVAALFYSNTAPDINVLLSTADPNLRAKIDLRCQPFSFRNRR